MIACVKKRDGACRLSGRYAEVSRRHRGVPATVQRARGFGRFEEEAIRREKSARPASAIGYPTCEPCEKGSSCECRVGER